MPTLLETPPTNEQPIVETHGRASLRWSGKLLPISLLIGCMLTIIVASLNYVTKADEEQLEALQAMIDKREPLKDYEKKAYCDLLWEVKQIRLCACKKNFIKEIGSLTGYPVKDVDLDWRDSGRTFEEALEEAFKRTGVPKEKFYANDWAKDINGKSDVVEWIGPGGAEVSVDAPHKYEGPDVFHIGFKTSEKGKKRVKGHIFLDCVPYFRNVE